MKRHTPHKYLSIGLCLVLVGIVIGIHAIQKSAPSASTLISPSESPTSAYLQGKVTLTNGLPASGVSIYINNHGVGIHNDGTYAFSAKLPAEEVSVRFYNPSTGERYRLKGSLESTFSYDPTENRNYNFVIELITNASPSPTPNPTPTPTPLPVIQSFVAEKDSVRQGTSACISWVTNNPVSLQLAVSGATSNLQLSSDSGRKCFTPSQTTTYTLFAWKGGAASSQTVTITVTPPAATPPAAPGNIRATNDGTNIITLSWNKVTNATGYYIYRALDITNSDERTDPTAEMITSRGVQVPVTQTFTDTLSPNDAGQYVYWVRAIKTIGDDTAVSSASAIASVTAKVSVPVTPTNLSVSSMSGHKIKLTWRLADPGASASNRSFEVWRKATGQSDFTFYEDLTWNETYDGLTGGDKKFKWIDTGLPAATRFDYKIRAYRTIRGEKVYSNFSTTDGAKS